MKKSFIAGVLLISWRIIFSQSPCIQVIYKLTASSLSYKETKFIQKNKYFSHLQVMTETDDDKVNIAIDTFSDSYYKMEVKNDYTEYDKNCDISINLINDPKKQRVFRFLVDFDFINKLSDFIDPKLKLQLVVDKVEIKWKLHDEFKTTDSIKCQKATTTFRCKDYIAWFTRETPIRIGPGIFYDTPGLIVELYNKENTIYWRLMSVKKRNDFKFSNVYNNLLSKVKSCNYVSFCSRKKDFKELKARLIKQMGGKNCKYCTSRINSIKLNECFNSCH